MNDHKDVGLDVHQATISAAAHNLSYGHGPNESRYIQMEASGGGKRTAKQEVSDEIQHCLS